MMKQVARVVLVGLMAIVIVLFTLWSSMALWIDGPATRSMPGLLAAGYALGGLLAFLLVRPYRRAVLVWLAATGLILSWWLSIPPRSDRNWMEDVSRLPKAEINGDRLTIHHLRNFDYRSEADFTPRWETRTYDLSTIRGANLFLSYWGPRNIAHTIMSWDFAEGPPLAISIETRKEVGESYSALLGFFRQYELYYVVADERDVVRLRTNFRGETVYLYPLLAKPGQPRAFLLDYLRSVNELVEHPRWYNAFTHNCTTTIRMHAEHISAANAWNWRILLNGYGDELLYMNRRVDTSLPFPQLRARSDITARAQAAGNQPDFSARIRMGLPGR
jgi:hypothetical protein